MENEMYIDDQFVRAEQTQRLGEAQRLRRNRQLTLARRKAIRAERAALQARLILARVL